MKNQKKGARTNGVRVLWKCGPHTYAFHSQVLAPSWIGSRFNGMKPKKIVNVQFSIRNNN